MEADAKLQHQYNQHACQVRPLMPVEYADAHQDKESSATVPDAKSNAYQSKLYQLQANAHAQLDMMSSHMEPDVRNNKYNVCQLRCLITMVIVPAQVDRL